VNAASTSANPVMQNVGIVLAEVFRGRKFW
jgi:hypothetical protein